MFLVPAAVKVGAGLLKTFCRDINCGGPAPPASSGTHPGGDHPDDNFDVSSRMIELEELDVTKQGWKDLYGRTGIKKGYNGLFLEKIVTEAYAKLAATTTEADYNTEARQFGLVLDKAQTEAKHSFEETYYASADIAVLSDGFVDNAAELLLKKLKVPIREVKETFSPAALIKNQPVLLLPSGSLGGFQNSTHFKATLDEYVKNGGTIIVFAQANGYDYASLPTPDGTPITAYGWDEDQNCFADAVAIETWHQMLSGQNRATPTVNVDGYFMNYPQNSTVLLKRTANGQPAMIMYEHGAGRVIATTMYSDWAYGHGQASAEEIALVRDMLAWAKKPAQLPEFKAGEQVNLTMNISNSTNSDATQVKIMIQSPDRSRTVYGQIYNQPVAAGQSAPLSIYAASGSSSDLGIYHADYQLLDAAGNIIQPQAETDSGRFAVINPPQLQTPTTGIRMSITSPTQQVFFNEPFTYTFHIFNDTATTRNLTLKSWLPHTNRWHEWTVAANPNSETQITGSDLFIDTRWMFETLRAYLYDENGAQIGSYMLSFKGLYPKVDVTTTTGKVMYGRGETVSLAVNLKNTQNAASAVKLHVTVTDPSYSIVFSNVADISIPASGTSVQPYSFPLLANAQGGFYTISAEVFDSSDNKVGGDSASIEIPLSQISVTHTLPPAFVVGSNMMSFNLANNGKVAVNSGNLEYTLKDPDGVILNNDSLPFNLALAQSKTIDIPISLPALKFGAYTLSYSESDETKAGKSTTITLANSVNIVASFDKPSYRVRETGNLTLTLTNSGRFNLDNVSVTVSVPDAGYTDTKSMNIGQGQALSLQYAIQLPETIAAGQHAASVIVTLPGGSLVSKNVTFTVPQSALALSLNQSASVAGTTINPVIANNGGVDTQVQYRMTLYDAKSAQIADKSFTEIVPANGAFTLNLPVPAGAMDGGYTLVTAYSDQKTGRAEIVQKPLTITGVKAALTLQTAKPAYLSTEGITALSNVINSGTLLQGSNLHLLVATAVGSQKQKTWTSQFDFQQGVRDGVDTYGVNDWIIPDDDFDGTTIDTSKWSPFGNVSIKSGKFFVDSSNVLSGMTGKWYIDGDFDIEVDFSNNKSFNIKGAQLVLSGVTFSGWIFIQNNPAQGYQSAINIGGQDVVQRATGGGLVANGSFRIQRTGSTIATFYKNGSTWVEMLKGTYPELSSILHVSPYLWSGFPSPNTTVEFDNFTVKGRIKTESQTVDSIRLLPLHDNFDDGSLNSDRWSVRSTGSVATNELGGNLVTKLTLDGVQSYSNVASRFPLEGDFDISIDWKAPVAPATGDWGSIFQLNELDQNIAPDNTLTGNALQIKRAYINGLGHVYQAGHYNGTTWDSLSSPVSTTDISGRFRVQKTGSLVTVWYWNSSLKRWEWNNDTAGYTWSSAWTTPSFVQFGTANNAPGNPAAETSWNNFKAGSGAAYLGKGTIRLKQDAGQTSNWQTISWNSTEPIGTSVKFRARTAENEGDLANAPWVYYVTSGSLITNPKGRWIELEATLATMNTSVTPLLNDVTVTYGSSQGDILWQADVPLNLAQGAVSDFTNTVGTLGNAGKYYLQGTVTSTTGQAIATSESAFFIAQGNTALSVLPDKRVYSPGETVTITGEVRNHATVEAANLSLLLKGKLSGGTEQPLATETFTIPSGGSHSFTVTTTAGTNGVVTLTGAVTQNSSILAEITDQYEVAAPNVTATLTAQDTASNDPFTMNLQLANSGKTDATVTVAKSFPSLPETVSVPAGQTRLLQYSQQISADTAYTFTLTGDLTQAVSKTVKYGLAGNITITPQTLYSEGKVAIPATVTNGGSMDGQFGVNYQLTQAATVLNQQAATYYITKGGNAADNLSYNLTEGSYQLTAIGQLPALAATTNFTVRKEIKADLTQTIGTQSGTSLPVTIKITNLGFNAISGTVRLSLLDAQSSAVWSASQDVSLPQALAPVPQALAFIINLSAVKPGSYTIKAELLDSGNRQLAAQVAPFTLLAPIFALTQIPPYQTFQPGASGTFTFKIKNSGNREGACTLAFKAADLSDSSRTEWLKPGEEKELSFTETLPVDLDEKDYSAAYRLSGNGITVAEDVVRYRLAGINLNVSASLDRQQYRPGETATFTLTVDQPAGTAPLEMFVRVHYNSYDEKRSFTLSGSQTLTFNVPLAAITGEKLFYGIYHQSGRSIHLNTMYVNAANDQLAISSDKQVYNPGETVAVTVQGSVAGDLLLTGPGGFSTAMTFSGTASRGILLPPDMTAGTYMITAQLKTQNSELITTSHPIDVAGLKITLREARLDKAAYSASDTMKLTVTIESNQDLSAMLRTWVVDPTGTYTEAGSGDIALAATSPLISTLNSHLATASAGIHKLVYGIYRGNDLIASGAKAFDIGDALVTAVSTDKRDYTGINEPVTVKVEMFGTATGKLALQLDGTTVQTASVTLNGFGSQAAPLQPGTVTPGRHVVKAILSAGGLISTRETEFVYGTTLPDLTTRLTAQPPNGQELLLTATVTNQGKSAAGQSSLTLYDGNPSAGGTVIAVLPVPALDAGASTSQSYHWNILGKAGEHLVYAVADSNNTIVEFDERNNMSLSSFTLPSFAFSIATGKTVYAANEEAALSVTLANLSASNAYPDAAVELKLTDPAGAVQSLVVKALPLQPAYATGFVTSWNTGSSMPGGYTLKGRLLSGATELAAQEVGFTIQPTVVITGNFTLSKNEVLPGSPLSIATSVLNSGNVDVTTGEILVEIVNTTNGAISQSQTLPIEHLVVLGKSLLTVSVDKVDVPSGEYLLRVTALTGGLRFALGEQLLKVLPPLEITHGFDLAPRVLVLAGREKADAKSSDPVELQIRQTLSGTGIFFSIVNDPDGFRRELRSGMYNMFILAGSRPLVDHLDDELAERVFAGDGLILFSYDKLDDQKMREFTGVKTEGRLPAALRPLTILPGPMTNAGSDQVTGTPLKLRLLSATAQAAVTVGDKGNDYPFVVINPYGTGRVAIFASDASAGLLRNAVSYVTPLQAEPIAGVPLNAVITLKSSGAPFDLRVTESVPMAMPILMTRPLGTMDQNRITWLTSLAQGATATFAYAVGLPESGGWFEMNTEMSFAKGGGYELYRTMPHTVGTERSLADIRMDVLNQLHSIPVTGKDADALDHIIGKYGTFLAMPDYSAQQLDRVIGQLLAVVDELRGLSADTAAVRQDLDRLLKVYGVKWRAYSGMM